MNYSFFEDNFRVELRPDLLPGRSKVLFFDSGRNVSGEYFSVHEVLTEIDLKVRMRGWDDWYLSENDLIKVRTWLKSLLDDKVFSL